MPRKIKIRRPVNLEKMIKRGLASGAGRIPLFHGQRGVSREFPFSVPRPQLGCLCFHFPSSLLELGWGWGVYLSFQKAMQLLGVHPTEKNVSEDVYCSPVCDTVIGVCVCVCMFNIEKVWGASLVV